LLAALGLLGFHRQSAAPHTQNAPIRRRAPIRLTNGPPWKKLLRTLAREMPAISDTPSALLIVEGHMAASTETDWL
jgi:hypothetical protein